MKIYKMKRTEFVSVMGGINIDVKGYPYESLELRTSNPGTVFYSSGGVARNIAHNLSKLSIPVKIFGAIGKDTFGEIISKELEKLGIITKGIKVSNSFKTGSYLAILNEKRDMYVSISDMEILSDVNEVYIEKCKDDILESKILFLDTNLNVSVINYALNLVKSKNIQTIINAVSIKKAKKLLHVTENIDFLTMNFIELESIMGKNLDFYEKDTIKDKLKDTFPNVSNIIITNGELGIYFVDNFKREIAFFQVDELSETEIVDSNGAGDAFTAGVIYGLYKNESIENCITYGINASRITLKSLKTVADELSETLIKNKN
ncbi:hypothetical protein X924_02030 [Petrotoga sp. 9PWA.NaAc.5.4]|nr:hypothetical protein X924_02030 [Petrotoga sp. 9PWA.NaAc.5.4]